VSVCDPTKVGGSATASMKDNGRPISCYFWILLQARWCRKISWNSCELVGLICSNRQYSRTTNAGDGMEIVCLFIRKGLICQGCCFRREQRKFLRAESSLLVDTWMCATCMKNLTCPTLFKTMCKMYNILIKFTLILRKIIFGTKVIHN
jgi:hypothetical protein